MAKLSGHAATRGRIVTMLLQHHEWADGHIGYMLGSAPRTVKRVRRILETEGFIPLQEIRQRRDGMWVARHGNRWVLEKDRQEVKRKLALLKKGNNEA